MGEAGEWKGVSEAEESVNRGKNAEQMRHLVYVDGFQEIRSVW